MSKPPHIAEIFLQPGGFHFGGRNTRIRTLLGSCVAITLWHPRLHIGGMCHYMLARRAARHSQALDGRYGEDALALFLREIAAAGTRAAEYQVKLFGGGRMFPGGHPERQPLRPECSGEAHCACLGVACKNSQAARHLVERHGFKVTAEHLGATGHRQVVFDIWSGHVWLKHIPIILPRQGALERVQTS